jgi:hypothetical protein
MIGIAAFVWAILQHVRRLDQMQRRVVLESLVLPFAGAGFGSTAWGFAEKAGAPPLPAFAILPVMSALWFVGAFMAYRRCGCGTRR